MAKEKTTKTVEKQDSVAPVSLMKKQWFTFAVMGLMGLITLFAGLIFASYNYMKYRYVRSGPLTQAAVYVVPEGAGISSLAGKLEADGLIDSAAILKLNAKLTAIGSSLKVGEPRQRERFYPKHICIRAE